MIDPRILFPGGSVETADSALLALALATEIYLDPKGSPFAAAAAASAISGVSKHLFRAIQNPKDPDHQTGLACATAASGIALSSSKPISVYLLARCLAGIADAPVGILSGILLPAWLSRLQRAAGSKIQRLLPLLTKPSGWAGATETTKSQQSINWLWELLYDLHESSSRDIPKNLAGTGIDRRKLGEAAETFASESAMVPDTAVAMKILEIAWENNPADLIP
jgi:alcohol dehydrogenase class IV